MEAAMTEPEFMPLPLVYVGIDDVPILYANQFIVQHQQDEFIISVGQVSPPVLLGDEAEQREQAARLSYVPVRVVARLGLTRQRLAELITVLETNLEHFDAEKGRAN
jgi:flagellar motor switch/type III secretory pathway protein FliN